MLGPQRLVPDAKLGIRPAEAVSTITSAELAGGGRSPDLRLAQGPG